MGTDFLALVTPIYFADITGQLKAFVDRCYSFLKPFDNKTGPDAIRIPTSKKMVLITARKQPVW
jgi:multimeric flavodoxin WrbA